MIVHYFFLLLIIFLLPSKSKDEPVYKSRLKVVAIALLVFLSIRYEYGNDYANYKIIYDSVRRGGDSFGVEIGYIVLSHIVPNFYLLIFLISAFYIFVLYMFIKKEVATEYYFLALLILLLNPYLFLINLSAIRQTIAALIFILGIHYLLERNFFAYMFIVLIAFLLHRTSLVLVPVYFLADTRKIKNTHVYILAAVLLVLILTPRILMVINAVAAFIPEKYQEYISGQQGQFRTGLLSLVMLVIMGEFLEELEGKQLVFAKLFMIGTIITTLSVALNLLARFTFFFDFFALVTIPYLLKHSQKRDLITIFTIYTLGVYGFRYYNFFNDPNFKDSYGTYRTIFSLL